MGRTSIGKYNCAWTWYEQSCDKKLFYLDHKLELVEDNKEERIMIKENKDRQDAIYLFSIYLMNGKKAT